MLPKSSYCQALHLLPHLKERREGKLISGSWRRGGASNARQLIAKTARQGGSTGGKISHAAALILEGRRLEKNGKQIRKISDDSFRSKQTKQKGSTSPKRTLTTIERRPLRQSTVFASQLPVTGPLAVSLRQSRVQQSACFRLPAARLPSIFSTMATYRLWASRMAPSTAGCEQHLTRSRKPFRPSGVSQTEAWQSLRAAMRCAKCFFPSSLLPHLLLNSSTQPPPSRSFPQSS